MAKRPKVIHLEDSAPYEATCSEDGCDEKTTAIITWGVEPWIAVCRACAIRLLRTQPGYSWLMQASDGE